jgi:hypothetical protein
MEEHHTIEYLLLRAKCWRDEAKRFAGRPAEATVCLEHAQNVETLAEGCASWMKFNQSCAFC